MSYRVVFNREACEGYANCMIVAPEIWGFDEVANKAVLLNERPGEELRAKAEASARGCPAQAITIDDADE